jgi:hypothetical protein
MHFVLDCKKQPEYMDSSVARRGASPEMIPKVERGVACRGGDS